MKIKEGFVLRNVCGENVNGTAAYFWKAVAGRDFTNEDLTELLLSEYDVEREIASADAAALSEKWIEAGVVEK